MVKKLKKYACFFIASLVILSSWHVVYGMGPYEKALERYKAGKFSEAIELLNQKPVKDAGDYNLLGWAFLKNRNIVEAIQHFHQSLSINPFLYDSYCGLGFSFFQTGKFRDALDYFNKGTPQETQDIDCLLGKALVLENLQDPAEAAEVYKRILSIDKGNRIAKEKLETVSSENITDEKEDFNFFARGDYFWVQRGKEKVEPLFIKGVDIGFGLPGRFPTEFPEDMNIYLEWFKLISEMNANVIRVYTILPPQFYKALNIFNQGKNAKDKLFFIQGIWVEIPEDHNFKGAIYLDEVRKEIRNTVGVVHGDAVIPHRYGHAYGTYRHDVSSYLMGFIFGREWEPPAVIAYNRLSPEKDFNGKYLSVADASPMEAWLTEVLDYLISYEVERYKVMRPVTFINWPPLDPLFHQSEATFREEVEFRRKSGEIIGEIDYTKAFDEDAVHLDETKIKVKKDFVAGIFASYHVYPYYPDFLRYEERYAGTTHFKETGYYYNYLKELKSQYKEMPVLISEFGIPTSRGIAIFHPEGMHHGGHNEDEQAEVLEKLMLSIKEAGCAGGIAFEWIDEWFKSNWMVRGMEEKGQLWYNTQDPEESYGLMAMSPIITEKLNGKASAWEMATLLYNDDGKSPLKVLNDHFDGARDIRRLYTDFDAGYLYLRIDVGGKIDWDAVAYLIAVDTTGNEEGDHLLPFNLGVESPIGFEFVILIHGERSKILIDDKYNRRIFDPQLLKYPGLSGYKENVDFRPLYNRNGLFTELITTYRRRFSRDGVLFPEKAYNASPLRQGSLTQDSLADFYYSNENNFIEIRIPWNLLYFADPSSLQIIYSNKEKRNIDGIRIMAASYKPRSIDDSTASELQDKVNVTDIIPENVGDMQYYRWNGWESPRYIMRLKKSYYMMKDVYGKIRNPEMKINLSAGFDFIPVIKNHFDSIEKFNELYNIDNSKDLYGLALANLVKGLIQDNPFYILEAKSLFSAFYDLSTDAREKEISQSGMEYIESILSGVYGKVIDKKGSFKEIYIEKYKPPKKDFRKIIIGKSAIKLKKGAKIATQVDRVTRDWLLGYNAGSSPWYYNGENAVPWHEGEKIREIVSFTDAEVYPVWGTKVKKIGGNWYAPDAEGVFRFIISEDKVYQYPTNIILDDETVILNDTHGISAIAWGSLQTDLVVGCGDYKGKVEAAYYLANKGVNVYMPTDRNLSMLIGTNTAGTIIGSAPVRKAIGGAIIGDQPVSIDINEPIVVSNSSGGYPLQYYDTPYRYFKELERYLGKTMNIIPVDITEYGKGSKVVEIARRVKAKLVGIRVWGREEHDAVYSWLKEDKAHRAILFHSAVYPEGYRLFFEFPQQTTFGDINIYLE